jgi:hypothetical protein
MKAREILSISIVGLGLIIAAVPENTTHPYKLTASQLLEEVKGRNQFFSPDELAEKTGAQLSDGKILKRMEEILEKWDSLYS